MREYVLTDLSPEQTGAIEAELIKRGLGAGIEHLFWLPVPPEALSPPQKEHTACGPHMAALEITETSVRLELLVRARNQLRCRCVAYADSAQMSALMAELHALLEKLGITC